MLDPSPFVDPATGAAYLLWKSNDGSSAEPSQVWSVQLAADGTSFAGTPTVLLTVSQAALPWETTFDDPQLVSAGGTYDLLFSVGDFLSASYAQALTTCSGPLGPCAQPSSGPFLSSYGSVAGPGGGALFTDASGNWWLAYAGWPSSCTNYSCGGVRRLFVAPIDLSDGLSVPCHPPSGPPSGYRLTASDGGIFNFGNLPFCGSTGGIHLNQPVVGMAGTTDGGGYWMVASDGGIFAFGDAGFYGSTGGIHLNQPIVGMAATPEGRATGWWPPTAASSPSVTPASTARPAVSTSTSPSWAWPRPRTARATGWWPPTAASSPSVTPGSTGRPAASTSTSPSWAWPPTPDGRGYWLVAADGGIFAFGDAGFYGSTGGIHLNQPIVGMAATPTAGATGWWPPTAASSPSVTPGSSARPAASTSTSPIVGMSAS